MRSTPGLSLVLSKMAWRFFVPVLVVFGSASRGQIHLHTQGGREVPLFLLPRGFLS